MPENTKDRDAVIAFARAVRDAQTRTGGSAETPDDRTQRYLQKAQQTPPSPAFETPDQRSQRYLEKSKALPVRQTVFSDPHPYGDDSPEEDFEMADDGTLKPTQERPKPPAWYEGGGGEREMGELADAAPKLSPERKAQLEKAMFNLRQTGQKIDIGIRQGRLNAEEHKGDGIVRAGVNLAVNNPWMKALEKAVNAPEAARNAEPKTRDVQRYARSDGEDNDTTVWVKNPDGSFRRTK